MSKELIRVLCWGVVLLFCFWLLLKPVAEAFGGWPQFIEVFGNFVAMALVIIVGFIILIAFIYGLTVYRSNRYAKKLRAWGDRVEIDKFHVFIFALLSFMALGSLGGAGFLTERYVTISHCIDVGECWKPEEWYWFMLMLTATFWFMGIGSLACAVGLWWKSFRPLKRRYFSLRRMSIQLVRKRLT